MAVTNLGKTMYITVWLSHKDAITADAFDSQENMDLFTELEMIDKQPKINGSL